MKTFVCHLNISQEVLKEISENIAMHNKESGGILGSTDGKTIDAFYFDLGIESKNNEYVPNALLLNDILLEWEKRNIEFLGMIHSHFSYASLSYMDLEYARTVMNVNAINEIIMAIYFMKNDSIYLYKVQK